MGEGAGEAGGRSGGKGLKGIISISIVNRIFF